MRGGRGHGRGILRVARAVAVALALGIAASRGALAHAAEADSLGVQSVLDRESARIDSLLTPETLSLDTTGVESLAALYDAGGLAAVRAAAPDLVHDPQAGVRFEMRPFALSSYNRVEGLRPSLGFALIAGAGRGRGLARLRRTELDLAAGYGLERERWVARGELRLGPKSSGPGARFWVSDLVLPFGAGPGEDASIARNAVLALVAGQDRQDYLRSRAFGVEITPWRAPRREARGAGGRAGITLFSRDESSLSAVHEFQLFGGGSPISAPNPPVDEGVTRGAAARIELPWARGAGRAAIETGAAGGALGGDFDFSWQSGSAELERGLPGGATHLAIEALHVGGGPPLQDAAHLGGDLTLRGYSRFAFQGETRASARFEYALAFDLLGATGLPLLRALRLQFIPFADAGTTWGERRLPASDDTGAPAAAVLLDGEVRTSFGVGVQRSIWVPGLESLRLDVIHRNDGAGDPWSFWLRAVRAFE